MRTTGEDYYPYLWGSRDAGCKHTALLPREDIMEIGTKNK